MCHISSLPLQLTQATCVFYLTTSYYSSCFISNWCCKRQKKINVYLVIKVCCFCLKDISGSKFSKKWCSKKDRALVLKHILYISIQVKPRIQSIFCIVIVYRYGKCTDSQNKTLLTPACPWVAGDNISRWQVCCGCVCICLRVCDPAHTVTSGALALQHTLQLCQD